jgi:hypothetical protein
VMTETRETDRAARLNREVWDPAGDRTTAVEWRRTLGSLVTAVARAGFRITHLAECGEETAQTKYGLPAGATGAFVLRAVKA